MGNNANYADTALRQAIEIDPRQAGQVPSTKGLSGQPVLLPNTASVLDAVFNPENWEFIAAYVCVGGFFAGLVFATMMVSIPMILDRDTDAITAGLTSLSVFYERTLVAVFWGALITTLVWLAILPFALGLVVVGPWLGFASWHAYRDLVVYDPSVH